MKREMKEIHTVIHYEEKNIQNKSRLKNNKIKIRDYRELHKIKY